MTMWLNQSLPNESAAVNRSPSTASAEYPPLDEPDGPHASTPESINDRDDPMLNPDTPSPASRSTSHQSPTIPLTIKRENTSYCFPASKEGSTTRTHGFYPVSKWDDCKTVQAALISDYQEKTDTLTISIVPFYPYNELSEHGRQWTDSAKWASVVTSINRFMATIHDDDSLYIRLATLKTAKHISEGQTLPLMLFLNSMMSHHRNISIEAEGPVDGFNIVFREGMRELPDDEQGANGESGSRPRVKEKPANGSLALAPKGLKAIQTRISEGTLNIQTPKSPSVCIVGRVPIWTVDGVAK
jgi:hypothetical protein